MSRTGTILAQFPATPGVGAFQTPYGLANDASGVYVADTYNNRVQKISKTDGSVLWTPDQLQPHDEPDVLASA